MLALPLALALLLSAGGPPADPAGRTLSKSARRAAARSARPAPEPASEPLGDPGKLLVEAKCGKCHAVDRSRASTLSDAAWRSHLKRMGKLPGAAITDDQARQIHEYLRRSAPTP